MNGLGRTADTLLLGGRFEGRGRPLERANAIVEPRGGDLGTVRVGNLVPDALSYAPDESDVFFERADGPRAVPHRRVVAVEVRLSLWLWRDLLGQHAVEIVPDVIVGVGVFFVSQF
jgi:hypothetical protein